MTDSYTLKSLSINTLLGICGKVAFPKDETEVLFFLGCSAAREQAQHFKRVCHCLIAKNM